MRRQLSAAQATFLAGPSLVIDDAPPAPSQMETQPSQSQRGAMNTSRRKIILSEQAVEEAMQLAHEGKVSAKNAWDVKLIEGMQSSVEGFLNQRADQYAQFAKAATLVESGAKVWTHRVESTYTMSNQMVRRLLRNEKGADTEEAPEDAENPQDGSQATQTQQTQRKKRRAERTLADSVDEINLENKKNEAVGARGTVSAMFRAMTEKFEPGHAQGLLLSNVPLGAHVNLILDTDYSAQEKNMQRLDRAALPTADPLPVQDEGGACEAIRLPTPRPSQHALSQGGGTPHSMLPHEPPQVVEPMPITREGSLTAARGESDLPPANEGGTFEPYDYGDGPEGEDDDAPLNDEVANSNQLDVSAHPSRIGSIARGIVSGDLDVLDSHLAACALAAEDPTGWQPLSQQAAATGIRKGPATTQLVSTIRREAKTATAASQPPTKKRRSEKTVKFASDNAQQILSSTVEISINKNEFAATTPLWKHWAAQDLGRQYASWKYCDQRATENGFVIHTLPGAELPSWMPRDQTNVLQFFQPFCTTAPHWNLLKKTVRRQQQQGGAPSAMNFEYGTGDEEPTDVTVAEMPLHVFDDDGPDDDDGAAEAAPSVFNVPAAEDAELPDLQLMPLDDAKDVPLPVPLVEGCGTIKLLKIQQATLPTQVDVVKLRTCMWNRTEGLLASTTAEHPQKRARHDGVAPDVAKPEADPTFSQVVSEVLPYVPSFSKDGTLSPAFFLFSLLFLANEHGLILESSDKLNDITVHRE